MRPILLLVMAMLLLSGCFVHSHRRTHDSRRARACAPSSHWDGHGCKHNGKKKGHKGGHPGWPGDRH